MNYPKLGNYQGGGMLAKRKARKLKQRAKFLDKELQKNTRRGRDDGRPKRQQEFSFNEDTDYNRRIKAGMAGIRRKQAIMEARADVRKARRSKRVNRKFESLRDAKKTQLRAAKDRLKTAKSQDFGKRRMRREMVKTGQGANLGPGQIQGRFTSRDSIATTSDKINRGKMRGGRAGFRGKARTKKVR